MNNSRKKDILPFSLGDLFIRITLRDPMGQIVEERAEPGHSWLRNAYNYALSCMTGCGGDDVNSFGAGHMSIMGTNAFLGYNSAYPACAYVDTVPDSYGMCYNGTVSSYGIRVGNSDAAFDLDHHNMQGYITSGSGSGQLIHYAMAKPSMVYSSKKWTVTQKRTFRNESGSQIDVKEVGIAYRGYHFAGIKAILLTRDILASTLEVPDQSFFDVLYSFSRDFSDID